MHQRRHCRRARDIANRRQHIIGAGHDRLRLNGECRRVGVSACRSRNKQRDEAIESDEQRPTMRRRVSMYDVGDCGLAMASNLDAGWANVWRRGGGG
jgi:hypothetical protein